jgi:bifunctional non-homologous end joining protein LigD
VATKAGFVEPMLLRRVDALPEGDGWLREIKFDGYRAIAFKADGILRLRSRNNKDFSEKYRWVMEGLAKLPNNTVIDGELVAFDAEGNQSFSALQNFGAEPGNIAFFVFDLLMLSGKDVTRLPLSERRALLHAKVLPKLKAPVRHVNSYDAPLSLLVRAVKEKGLEGLVAKRLDSSYEPGLRTGAWQKMRVNRGQEFVVGGYTHGTKTFDALVFGVYEGKKLIYVARTRNGFTPASRAALFKQFKGLETAECPFANLPEPRGGRWGQGLTEAKMAECTWLKPRLVAQIEFLEWTADNHLRHSKFVGLREDKKAKDVRRE